MEIKTKFQKEKEVGVLISIRVHPILLKYFDEDTKPRGYSRQEAIREAMRRFTNYGKKGFKNK